MSEIANDRGQEVRNDIANDVKWTPDIDINTVPEGTILIGVRTDHAVLQRQRDVYINKRCKGPSWVRNCAEKKANFAPPPMYYCQRCKQIEDGNHRLHICDELGIDEIDILIAKICYKAQRDHPDLSNGSAGRLAFIEEALREKPTEKIHKDLLWVESCHRQKWPLIQKHVNFLDATVLDVGCQSGYIGVEVWAEGAKSYDGFDIRDDILATARAAMDKIVLATSKGTFQKMWNFQNFDWIDRQTPSKFDVVVCMGLLHYFPLDEYQSALSRLIEATKQFLVIECRVLEYGEKAVRVFANQTLSHRDWLIENVTAKGFELLAEKEIDSISKRSTRTLAIFKRK